MKILNQRKTQHFILRTLNSNSKIYYKRANYSLVEENTLIGEDLIG